MSALGSISNCCTAPGKNLSVRPPSHHNQGHWRAHDYKDAMKLTKASKGDKSECIYKRYISIAVPDWVKPKTKEIQQRKWLTNGYYVITTSQKQSHDMIKLKTLAS